MDIHWHTFEEQLKFPAILDKENLDLVHFPYFSVPIFYNKPFVVTIHDLILHHFPTGQASTLPWPVYWIKLLGYRFVMKMAAQKAQKIITVSQATKDEIITHLHAEPNKIVVTYEGIDEKITNSKSQITNKIQNTKYFLYVGNAYPHKNLERLIEAFRNDAHLILVGKEDFFYKRLKEKVRKMGLENRIIFLGEVTDGELVGLYKNALALVAPSLMEGFGLPILEAMSNKCLVLASDIPVHHEIAGDVAIYFDPKNVDDMSKKMMSIEISDRIQKGLDKAKMFSWEKMAKETLSVYESSISI